jgi:hypothetical protein
MLPAKLAIFAQRKLLFHLFLVPLRIRGDAAALRTLHLSHVVLDFPHSPFKNITASVYGKIPNPST